MHSISMLLVDIYIYKILQQQQNIAAQNIPFKSIICYCIYLMLISATVLKNAVLYATWNIILQYITDLKKKGKYFGILYTRVQKNTLFVMVNLIIFQSLKFLHLRSRIRVLSSTQRWRVEGHHAVYRLKGKGSRHSHADLILPYNDFP